jgi:hypothetical protein
MGKHFYGTAPQKSEAMDLATYYAKHYKNGVCYTPSKESSCVYNETTQMWTCMAAGHHHMGSCGRNELDTQRGENIRRDRDRPDVGGGGHKNAQPIFKKDSEIEKEDYMDASQEDYFENKTDIK